MAAPRKVRKRCAQCGWTGKVSERQLHCHARRFGKGSFACWGQLVTVVRARRNPDAVPTPAGVGVGWQLGEEAEAQRMEQYRTKAKAELEKARKRLNAAIEDVSSATERLLRWRTQVARLEKKSMMTDAEIAAERQKRLEAAAKGRNKVRRRAMAV
jgi:hypothetical protein